MKNELHQQIIEVNKQNSNVLFINASEHFEKGKRQNRLRDGDEGQPNDIRKIVDTYQNRIEEDRYSRRVSMEEIEKNGFT